MSREIEDRLRQALNARADQVTPESLRPAEMPAEGAGRGRRRSPGPWFRGGLVAAAAATAVAIGIGVLGDDDRVQPAGPDTTVVPPTPTTVTGSSCSREAALVERSLADPVAEADVDGDGVLDPVGTALDPGAGPACRAFVGFRAADGSTYSTALDQTTTTPDIGPVPVVVGTPDLGADGDAELVVDTGFAADGQRAQLFTFTGEGLVWVPTAAFEDGGFYVTGGGVTSPRGADCTADGALVLSMAVQVDGGERFEVTRHVYPAAGDPLELGSPRVESETVPVAQLAERYPEFGDSHWGACG